MLKNQKNIYIPKMLTQYFNQYILGNLDNYEKKGFNIYLGKDKIIVIIKKNIQLISL